MGAFLPCLMVCLLASSSGDMPSLLSHEIFLGKVDVNPGIARFLAVQSYVPESYFISMVASHNSDEIVALLDSFVAVPVVC